MFNNAKSRIAAAIGLLIGAMYHNKWAPPKLSSRSNQFLGINTRSCRPRVNTYNTKNSWPGQTPEEKAERLAAAAQAKRERKWATNAVNQQRMRDASARQVRAHAGNMNMELRP